MTQSLTLEQISHNTGLLVQASSYGDLDAVKRLIPISNPKAYNSNALQWAAKYGYTDIVKMLIPVSDPKAYNSCALRHAAENGHIECVKLLIPVSDPKDNYSWALLLAAENGHIEIVKLLIPVSDYQIVAEELLDDNKDITLLQQHIDEYEAVLQKERLNITLAERVETKSQSVKRKM